MGIPNLKYLIKQHQFYIAKIPNIDNANFIINCNSCNRSIQTTNINLIGQKYSKSTLSEILNINQSKTKEDSK